MFTPGMMVNNMVLAYGNYSVLRINGGTHALLLFTGMTMIYSHVLIRGAKQYAVQSINYDWDEESFPRKRSGLDVLKISE